MTEPEGKFTDLMSDETDFDAAMEKMALILLSEANKDNVKLEEKVKVFDSVQQYHATREKYKGKPAGHGAANGKPTFGKFKSSVNEAPSQEQ